MFFLTGRAWAWAAPEERAVRIVAAWNCMHFNRHPCSSNFSFWTSWSKLRPYCRGPVRAQCSKAEKLSWARAQRQDYDRRSGSLSARNNNARRTSTTDLTRTHSATVVCLSVCCSTGFCFAFKLGSQYIHVLCLLKYRKQCFAQTHYHFHQFQTSLLGSITSN